MPPLQIFPARAPKCRMPEIRIDPRNLAGPVRLHIGDTIVVELPENPTTGFRWQGSPDSQLVPSADQFVPSRDAAPGGGGIRTLRFGVVAAGDGRLKLQLRREWETAMPQQSLEIPYQVN